MATICRNFSCVEGLSWNQVEQIIKCLVTPKLYLKIAETTASWGRYILPSFSNETDHVVAFMKSCAAPFVLLETVSATSKLGDYVFDIQGAKYNDFGSAFIHGSIVVGSFVGKSFKSVLWLNKMRVVVLAESTVFRLGAISSFCSCAKASLELFIKSSLLLEKVSAGGVPDQDDIVKYTKNFIEVAVSALSLYALYQSTAIGAFISLLLGTCSMGLDLI